MGPEHPSQDRNGAFRMESQHHRRARADLFYPSTLFSPYSPLGCLGTQPRTPCLPAELHHHLSLSSDFQLCGVGVLVGSVKGGQGLSVVCGRSARDTSGHIPVGLERQSDRNSSPVGKHVSSVLCHPRASFTLESKDRGIGTEMMEALGVLGGEQHSRGKR